MEQLDVDRLNTRAPYVVERRSKCDYAFRNRLFLRWLKEYARKEQFIVDHFEITADGVTNFAAIIVQVSNPKVNEIVTEYNDYLEILRKP